MEKSTTRRDLQGYTLKSLFRIRDALTTLVDYDFDARVHLKQKRRVEEELKERIKDEGYV